MKKFISLLLCVLFLGAVLSGCGGGAQKQNNTATDKDEKVIRVGTNRALGTVTPYIARDEGKFEQQGIKVNIIDFKDGASLMEAFSAGQLDIGLLGVAPAATWQEKGAALKVVASANGGGHVLLTRTDTGINDIKDLKGKKVATPNPGTVTDTLFREHILKNAGLQADTDINIVSGMAPADMPVALATKQVDAILTWEPFATQAENQFKDVKVLYDAAKEWKTANPGKANYPVNVVIASQPFIDNQPEQLKKFLQAYVQTVDFINNEPDKANEIISKELELDKSIIAKARERIDYTWKVDTASTLQTLTWSNKLGYLKNIPTADKLFDLKYLPQQ